MRSSPSLDCGRPTCAAERKTGDLPPKAAGEFTDCQFSSVSRLISDEIAETSTGWLCARNMSSVSTQPNSQWPISEMIEEAARDEGKTISAQDRRLRGAISVKLHASMFILDWFRRRAPAKKDRAVEHTVTRPTALPSQDGDLPAFTIARRRVPVKASLRLRYRKTLNAERCVPAVPGGGTAVVSFSRVRNARRASCLRGTRCHHALPPFPNDRQVAPPSAS